MLAILDKLQQLKKIYGNNGKMMKVSKFVKIKEKIWKSVDISEKRGTENEKWRKIVQNERRPPFFYR